MKAINKIRSMYFISILLLCILLISVDAQTIKQNKNIMLIQTCNNCTFCNVTKIVNPSGIEILNNVQMSKDGTSYNYTLNYSYTNAIGSYEWYYDCGNAYERATGMLTFDVNPTGYNNNLIFFYIVLFVIPWGLFLLGLWKKDMTFAILGTIGFYLVSLYLFIFGIDGVRDWLSNGLALIHLGVAFYTSIKYSLEAIG